MNKKIIFGFDENEKMAAAIAEQLGVTLGEVIFRHFPDEETLVRIKSEVKELEVILVCSLNQPDPKLMPIISFADTAKELGAKSVTLIAPYLAYMRQDKRFNPGESITSKTFATVVSQHFDYLITIDPHLHRYESLAEIYTIKTEVLHATNLIAQWIKNNIKNPVLIGPDAESKQWVSKVAHAANAPFIVLLKNRTGDHEVEVSVPQVQEYKNHTPVLVDDIISTARTMIETVKHLNAAKMQPTVCIGIHAVFAGDAYEALQKAGIAQVITCNTIPHVTNGIDVSQLISNKLL
jgi:ribose-phosphate pyrophosphokinase